MKKRIILTVLMILMYMFLTSFNSCTTGTTKSLTDSTKYEQSFKQDTNKNLNTFDTIVIYLTESENSTRMNSTISYTPKDTIVKRTIFRREIKPMEVDSTYIMKRDSSYKQLEKTEIELKEQHQKLDSLMLIKKK